MDNLDRSALKAKLADEPQWDLLVIGGGATGLGTALDAVSRGYRTVLLEGSDYAKGTSSRSTKLIHGGVRYLRSGQVRMVRESLVERGRLLQNAPHIVHPRKFLIPAYRRGARWYYYAGLKAYELLAGSLRMEPSRVRSKADSVASIPELATSGLRGGVEYLDGQFDDARLAIALLRTFLAQGGVALNYTRVEELVVRSGRVAGVVAQDLETGDSIEVSARCVVNATGVFSEEVMQLDSSAGTSERPKIAPSQGTHVVVSRDFLKSDVAMMIPDTDDGRVLFAIPWMGRTLLGTTDHEVESVSLEPRPLESEIEYLLEHFSRYIKLAPERRDVLSAFSGLRPLVDKRGATGGTASLSREHEIFTSPAGMISVIGGKWTTYRKMGEDVVNLAAKVANLNQQPSRTPEMRLVGAPESTHTAATSKVLEPYGSEVTELQERIASHPKLGEKLHDELPFLYAQVQWAMERELALTVDDILSRRTRALLMDAKAAIECAPQVAEFMRQHLERSQTWRDDQVRSFQTLAANYLL